MPDFSAFDTYIDTHSDRLIQRLRNLVRIPSVSAQGGPAMRHAADAGWPKGWGWERGFFRRQKAKGKRQKAKGKNSVTRQKSVKTNRLRDSL